LSVASSTDGQMLAAADGDGGHIFTSNDAGTSWLQNNVPVTGWQKIATSADGTRLIAAAWRSSSDPRGPIYTSTNSGLTWISNSIPTNVWNCVACSADGGKLMAVSIGTNMFSVGGGGDLEFSSDSLS
jgi:photosystem II stability/assembly factor-like uncharacterized protein